MVLWAANHYHSSSYIKQKRERMSVNLQERSLANASRLRQQQHERIFKRIRLQLLHDASEPIPTTEQGQQEILQAIESHRKRGTLLDFKAINNYICSYEGGFHGCFVDAVLEVVMAGGDFTDSPHALASLGNLLEKSRQYGGVNREEMTGWVRDLLRKNLQGSVNEHNLPPLCFLLYSLLTLSDDIRPFEAVGDYLKLMLDNLSCFSLQLLIYLGQASNHRALLPPRQLILQYLQSDIPADMPELALIQLSELMQNYYRFEHDSQLNMPYTHWVTKHLSSPRTPQSMRIDLLHLLTTILNSQDPSYLAHVAELEIWQEVTTLASFGHEADKHAALECLSTLVMRMPPQSLEDFVESHRVLEVLVYGLDMALREELKCTILTSLGLMLEILPRLRKIARALGLLKAVGRAGNSGNVKLTTVALDVRKMFD